MGGIWGRFSRLRGLLRGPWAIKNESEADVCIVSVARTPLGVFKGSLSPLSAVELGTAAVGGALRRARLDGRPQEVGEVFMGNVLSANLGQAPSKQVALGAGLNPGTPCTTVNKVCASGMKAVMLGAMTIKAGIADVVVAGGMESMSNVPFYSPRGGSETGIDPSSCIDGMLKDGLLDPFSAIHMGNCGELCAKTYGISRDAQDEYAMTSYKRAMKFRQISKLEHIPVQLPGIDSKVVDFDEGIDKLNEDKFYKLKPVFQKDGGTVTAGNSSQISDGSAAVVLARRSKAQELSLPILGRVLGMADAAQQPKWFTTAPALAFQRALQSTQLDKSDIDFVEINEAFAVVSLVNQKILDLDPNRVNVHGGAIALGHPLGCSGARLVVTLLNILREYEARRGLATICNGGGGASAIIIEREP